MRAVPEQPAEFCPAEFCVVPGAAVSRILAESRRAVLDVVRETYLLHHDRHSVNPDSYFLRFPAKPEARVIALPAYLGGGVDTIGIKWIASFPGNVEHGLPRASAVLLLNDYRTGYPIACIEAAAISAARTAASAALAADRLLATPPALVSFVGAGVIARTIADFLPAAGIGLGRALVFDQDRPSAEHLAGHLAAGGTEATVAGTLAEALAADLVVLATTAARPYVPTDTALRPGQVILNISLRDLPPELLLRSNNVLDDVEHCLKADTSPHLTEQLTGSRDFVTGTLAGVLRDEITLDAGRPTVFSPFGLGVLDVAVGAYVLGRSRESGEAIGIPDFIGERRRW